MGLSELLHASNILHFYKCAVSIYIYSDLPHTIELNTSCTQFFRGLIFVRFVYSKVHVVDNVYNCTTDLILSG